MLCSYSAKLKKRPLVDFNTCNDFRLTIGLVHNYEYSNGDGHMINRIESYNDVMILRTSYSLATKEQRTPLFALQSNAE
jgi:hypothetical protein